MIQEGTLTSFTLYDTHIS